MQKRLRFTKRTLALALVVVMAVGMFPLMAAASDYDDHWSKEFIDTAISRGWMKGYEDGSFRPDSSITRAEFSVMMWRAYGEPEPENANPFTDVPVGEWYDDATAALFELGITSGVGDNRFDPSGTLTREMGMTMLARAFGIEAEDAESYKSFDDAAEVSTWATEAVSALIEKGYISGVGDNLIAPQNPLKRGEMAKALAVTYDGEGGFPALSGGDKSITITLTYSPTVTTSGNVTVTAAVSSENGNIKYIGTRKATAGAVYDSKVGFTDITAASRFTVSENGWYAVCAEDETGAFAYKLINITNISKGGGGGIYVPTGGTWTVTFRLAPDATTAYKTETVKDGETVSKPDDPADTSEAYFVEWYNLEDGKAWDFGTAVKKNLTLVARWNEKNYELSIGDLLEGIGVLYAFIKPIDTKKVFESATFFGVEFDEDDATLDDGYFRIRLDVTEYATNWMEDARYEADRDDFIRRNLFVTLKDGGAPPEEPFVDTDMSKAYTIPFGSGTYVNIDVYLKDQSKTAAITIKTITAENPDAQGEKVAEFKPIENHTGLFYRAGTFEYIDVGETVEIEVTVSGKTQTYKLTVDGAVEQVV